MQSDEIKKDGPKVIGLAGGIASGKSAVAAMFARLGALVIDADAIARDVLDTPDVRTKLRQIWGPEYFDPTGRPDRARIAALAFKDPAKLRELTGWVHPTTRREIRARLKDALQNPCVSLIIIDAPLLIEAGLDAWCDAVVFVEADASLRAGRARSSRGWTDDELGRRESAQSSLDEKRRRADAVINNNGSTGDTLSQVTRLFNQWVSKSPRKGMCPTNSGGM